MTLLRLKAVVSVPVLIMCLVDAGGRDKVPRRFTVKKKEEGRDTTQCVSFGSNVVCRTTRNLCCRTVGVGVEYVDLHGGRIFMWRHRQAVAVGKQTVYNHRQRFH